MPRGAGRTDAGVHALGQVAHMDLAKDWEPDKIRDALNAQLRPDPISVLTCERAPEDFDARLSATARHYLYRIVDRRAPLALERNRAWGVFRSLDAEAMNEAAQVLVGHHDFTTFRSTECQAKSPIKTLDQLDVSRHGEIIRIETKARSFLHNQVRSMVGSLKLVGEGRWTASDLKPRSRRVTAPPADRSRPRKVSISLRSITERARPGFASESADPRPKGRFSAMLRDAAPWYPLPLGCRIDRPSALG